MFYLFERLLFVTNRQTFWVCVEFGCRIEVLIVIVQQLKIALHLIFMSSSHVVRLREVIYCQVISKARL